MNEKRTDFACRVEQLGMTGYSEAQEIQKELVQKKIKHKIEDHFFILEHPPTITLGRGAKEENLLITRRELVKKGIEFYNIKRGGGVTYHGPGQIIGYPIIDLKNHKKDLHWFMNQLEEVIINLLERFNLEAKRIENLTGVWINNKKIAAIGIAAKRWVTYHGFALNYNPDMNHFKLIHPCGIKNKGVISLAEILQKSPARDIVIKELINSFKKVFDYKLSGDISYG